MDTNEIMANEEVVETAEEIVEVSSGKGFRIAAGIGLAVLAGVIAYKYVAKPMIAKFKAQRELDQQKIFEEDLEYSENDDEEEEPSETE